MAQSQQADNKKCNNLPVARYLSHLVAASCRGSISCMRAGTLDFSYMEIHTVKYIFWNEMINPYSEKNPH